MIFETFTFGNVKAKRIRIKINLMVTTVSSSEIDVLRSKRLANGIENVVDVLRGVDLSTFSPVNWN